MRKHWNIALWALRIVWGLKGIWPVDRLRLWVKSISLYMAFLAFTDVGRPLAQLHHAMLSAVLSAVYDYDSDWLFGNRSGKNFFPLLEYVDSEAARKNGRALFQTDVGRNLSEDGLERGSVALQFYRLVIDSNWMRGYTSQEIDEFGRKLQILDDLLDLESDWTAGDTNCLLLPDRAQAFATEAEAFLDSDFFGMLKSNSLVYRVLEKKAREKLRNFRMREVTFTQLFVAGRPSTGLYAFVLSLISFGFYEGAPWLVPVLAGLTYAGLTMNIMVFNDWADRENDRKKGRLFASEHPRALMRYWLYLAGATALTLVSTAYWSVPLALFTTLVWVAGLAYSYTQQRIFWNNAIVAACSGSPALCGTVFHGEIRWIAVCTFGIFTTLIFINEIFKDVEDTRGDRGYKATMATEWSIKLALWYSIVLMYAPAILLAWHPNVWVMRIGWIACGWITLEQSAAFLHPQWIGRPMRAMRFALQALLVALLFS